MNVSFGDASRYSTLSPYNLSLQMYSNIGDHHNDNNSLNHHNHHQANNSINNNLSSGVASSLLYSLSILKDKVNQLQSLLTIILSEATADPSSSSSSSTATSVAIASVNMHNAIQEVIMTASSMLLTIQNQTAFTIPPNSGTHDNTNNNNNNHIGGSVSRSVLGQPLIYPSNTNYDWTYGDIGNQSLNNNDTTSTKDIKYNSSNDQMINPKNIISSTTNYDIIELGAADLLAKYTHYCQVCGKGFRRDANLRMHMRAHGDEYKTNAALTNPMKKIITSTSHDFPTSNVDDNLMELPKKYSCPQEGCRWNQRHAKFQPLKSMICVKNHYKRTHCPKMYVCKRCNRKQFSVLSDLRTHEKHCGDLKWQCSCGTTFSRKDKLMGHVALFHGHTPIMLSNLTASTNKIDKHESIVKIHKTE